MISTCMSSEHVMIIIVVVVIVIIVVIDIIEASYNVGDSGWIDICYIVVIFNTAEQ
jgi:hypothetical protein